MPPLDHALLGASSSHRWLHCTRSARWELDFQEEGSKEAAEEGTLAHAIAEEHLRKLLSGRKPATGAALKKHPLYKPVMEEHISVYTDYVMEHLEAARAHTADALLMLEERVDYSRYAPEGFGTSDGVLIADGEMDIFDLKYGKGVPVEAEGNPQIRLYALGALESYMQLYGIHLVRMHIIQPRLDSITSEQMRVVDLIQWGEDYVRPRAEKAFAGEGECTPGDWCMWCRCRHVCAALADQKLSIARARFTDAEPPEERTPDMLTNAEIADILLQVDGLTRWAKSVKDWALDQAVNHGAVFPGWKVVEGRSNRVISDEGEAIHLLDGAGFTTDRVTKLRGLTELEELVGKKQLAMLLGELIIKPAGKPVLAKESDKRPPMSSAAAAAAVFTPLEDE